MRLLALVIIFFSLTHGTEGEAFISSGSRRLSGIQLKSGLRLYRSWTQIYNLSDHISQERKLSSADFFVSKTVHLPAAPHLEDCVAQDEKRQKLESRLPDGRPPSWVGDDTNPRPPWVTGDDDDNLAKTRRAQTDIWEHQNPPDCNAPDLKFVIAEWPNTMNHGLGSQLHIMGSSLSVAVRYQRILVYAPNTFGRADHEECEGDLRGSLDCYFYPIAPPQCASQALRLWNTEKKAGDEIPLHKVLLSDQKVVWFSTFQVQFRLEAHAADIWGMPWRERNYSFEVNGRVPTSHPDSHVKVNWWLSQASRYMLRWQTVYLCHTTNRVRHESYGKIVAREVKDALLAQAPISKALKDKGGAGTTSLWASDSLERTLWEGDQPYVPRPIISMHLRQGDKAKEMKLVSLEEHMWHAERLRLRTPNLRTVWLSTEMQTVVDETSAYRGWHFLYSNVPRQQGDTAFYMYEKSVGTARLVGTSFANLIISSECDYFIGTLGSNWNRLINELRLTNGRFRAGYISLNDFDEW